VLNGPRAASKSIIGVEGSSIDLLAGVGLEDSGCDSVIVTVGVGEARGCGVVLSSSSSSSSDTIAAGGVGGRSEIFARLD
jgi:hypothetical protein